MFTETISPIAIEARIKDILASEIDVNPRLLASATPSTPLQGHGIGLDTMETLVLVAGIKDAFDVEINDGDLTDHPFTSFGGLVEYVHRQIVD